jgi:hypothetical protein
VCGQGRPNPSLPPLPTGRQALLKGGIPLFGKWFDEAHHPEFVEAEG